MRAWSRTWCLWALVAACGGPGMGPDAGPSGDAEPDRDGRVAPDGSAPSSVRISAAEGGVARSPDGAFTLIVPPGALAQDTDVSIAVVPRDEWPAEIAATDPVGEVYDVRPDGLAFVTPAFAVHHFDARPSELSASDGAAIFAVHHARSSDGAVEAIETRTISWPDGSVSAIAALSHLSHHWTSAKHEDVQYAADLDCRSGPHNVGSEWSCSRVTTYATGNVSARVSTFAEVMWPVGDSAGVVPVVPPGANVEMGAHPYRDRYLRHRATAPATPLDYAVGVAFDAMPLPSWACVEVDQTGRTSLQAGLRVELPGGPVLELASEWPHATCNPRPGPRRYETVARPEGVRVFRVGPEPAPVEVPTLQTTGLDEGLWSAVAGADGGLELVHLETGARRTNPWVGPSYGVVPAQTGPGPDGVSFITFGPGGTATTGWNGSLGDFGLTGLGGGGNTTDVVVADLDGDGFSEARLVTDNGSRVVTFDDGSGSGNTLIYGPAFPGGSFPAPPVSASFGFGEGQVVMVLENGELWFGPMSGPLALAGNAGTDPRLMRCTERTDPIVCAVAAHGDDAVYVAELDANGARVAASAPACDAPVEPAVRVTPSGTIVIALPCSGDAGLRIYGYDAAGDALTDAAPAATIEGCTTPNHCAWIDEGELLCSCFGGGGLVRVPIPAL